MPDLHELPDLVAPEDLELPAARRRVLWVRNHAFGLAFGVTLMLAGVLFARVLTLEARHAAAVEPPAVASVPTARDSSAVIVPAAQAEPEPEFYASVEREGLPTVATADAETRPAPPASASASRAAASRQAPTRRATRPRRSTRRDVPERVVQASAIPTRDVQAEAAGEEPDENRGTLTIQVRPWGSVFINDRLIHREVSARFQTHLEPGTYPVKVVHPVLGTWKGVAKVEAGREVAVFVNFNKEQ